MWYHSYRSFIHSFLVCTSRTGIAPNISLQSGRFWATSVVSFRDRLLCFRSSSTWYEGVLVVSSSSSRGRLLRYFYTCFVWHSRNVAEQGENIVTTLCISLLRIAMLYCTACTWRVLVWCIQFFHLQTLDLSGNHITRIDSLQANKVHSS